MASKIVLVNPPYQLGAKPETGVKNYPMGVLAVGSALTAAGYEVDLFDCIYEPNYNRRVLGSLRKPFFGERPLWVGLSVMTNQIACALQTARLVKRRRPKVPIVWGGIHPTLEPELTLAEDCCDLVITGEADRVVVELSRCLAEGGNLERVPGLYFKRDGRLIKTDPAPVVADLDELPSTDFKLVRLDNYLDLNVDKQFGYFPDEPGSVRRLSIQSARGCPFHCRFCINSLIRGYDQGRRYRSFSPDRLLTEIRKYKTQYDMNFLSFGDDLFFSDRQRTREIVDRLLAEDLDIKWYANIRADMFSEDYINADFLKKIRRAGCIRLAIGVESGSEKILSYLDKRLRPEHSLRAAKVTNETDITTGYSFMVGLPQEEDEDLYRTMTLIWRLSELHRRSYIIGPQLYRPYPGSQLFEDCVALGLKRPTRLAEWSEDLSLGGNYPIEKMVWVKNPDLTREAIRFVREEIPAKTAEAYLARHCPRILAEFLEIERNL